jgi:hypothetical protein
MMRKNIVINHFIYLQSIRACHSCYNERAENLEAGMTK